MAHAIENLIKIQCNVTSNQATSSAAYKQCQRSVEMRGVDLLKEIRQVEFDSITGRRVRFVDGGDGLAPYEVFQYQLFDPVHRKYGYLIHFIKLKKYSTFDKVRKFLP